MLLSNVCVYFENCVGLLVIPVVLIVPQPDQERNELGIISGTRVISATSSRELTSSFFLLGKEPKEIHTILIETLACLIVLLCFVLFLLYMIIIFLSNLERIESQIYAIKIHNIYLSHANTIHVLYCILQFVDRKYFTVRSGRY